MGTQNLAKVVYNLQSNIKRWSIRILLLISLVVAVLSGVSVVSDSPMFCEVCHTMRPQVMTWQASAHGKISCTTCHVEEGLKNTLKHEVEIVRRVFLETTQLYLLPVVTKYPVRNEICLECHTYVRTVTPLSDIKVPHESHVNVGLNCVDCHSGLVHARVTERNLTIDGDFERWTPQLGADQMLPENMRMGMNGCISCHSKLGKGPQASQCQACHQKMMTPESHQKASTWLVNHGRQAMQDVTQCDKCHNYVNVDNRKLTTADLDITQYAKNNSFCSNCHVNRPERHPIHTQGIGENSISCLVCHNLKEPKTWEKVPPIYCEKCHSENLGPVFTKKS